MSPNRAHETLLYWETSPGALSPYRATPEYAVVDLHAREEIRLQPKGIAVIDTGIGVRIPSAHMGLIAPRSGLARKGIQVLGGIIDRDYQGVIKVILLNSGENMLPIHNGDRIAQLIVVPVKISMITKGKPPTTLTIHGNKGFGSSDTMVPGAKVWVEKPTGPPVPAVLIASGNDQLVLVMEPGKKKWMHIPADKCYLRE
ncbi:deoxyuridine 5'-triphosphate nucleotidohydrolase-like [Ambystoma mexicanum]|uniref:deoxyuridine 5'-triphosphate nucleotidohydrolase-like n=1 Tax=Ambystoma mexicanum TaxID=8296 RepID=UPI0037E92FA9